MSTISSKVIFDMPKRFKKVEPLARARLVEEEPDPRPVRNTVSLKKQKKGEPKC